MHRDEWRGQALYLRSLFEAKRNVASPREQQVRTTLLSGEHTLNSLLQAIIKQTEQLLEKWKHPDPYKPVNAPGGTFHPVQRATNVTLISLISQAANTSATCPLIPLNVGDGHDTLQKLAH